MLLLTDPFKNSKLISMPVVQQREYIKDALSIVKTPFLSEKIRSSPLIKGQSGLPAYNFNLPDISGATIRLSDLKGNVVLMDMWYTGCTGCAIFADKLKKEIRPMLIGNPRFKIVSICVDNDRSKWMESLLRGQYTEQDNINLYLARGKKTIDFFHVPMVKYYGLEGLPFILLIDKNGKIVSQFTNASKTADILNEINKAILN
jgi:cytochrome oxidase Cu insertion factor (SCO1/SenC/PrrC family)